MLSIVKMVILSLKLTERTQSIHHKEAGFPERKIPSLSKKKSVMQDPFLTKSFVGQLAEKCCIESLIEKFRLEW